VQRILIMISVLALTLVACGTGTDAETETTVTETANSEAATSETTASTQPTTTSEATIADDTGAALLFVSAAERSAAATSARFEGSIAMEGVPELGSATITFSGAFDGTITEMSMDMSDVMAAGGEEVPPELSEGFSDIGFIFDGEQAYMKFPLFALMGAGTGWVSLPADEAFSTTGFGGLGAGNPIADMEAFADAGAEVTEIGVETVRGVSTTHYRVEFDGDDLAALGDESGSESLKDLQAESLPVDFWIGDDGLVYRYVVDLDGEALTDESEEFESLTITYEIFDYDVAFEIELPDASEVTDISDLGFPAP